MNNTDIDEPRPPNPATSRRLFQSGVGCLVATSAGFIWKASGDIGFTLVLGLGILIVACIPLLQWAKNRRTWFPAFEIFCLTCVAFYAIPLLTSHEELQLYSDSVIQTSAGLVFAYLVAACIGFNLQRNPAKPPFWASVSLVPRSFYKYIPLGLALNTLHLCIEAFTTLTPANFEGTLRALFFGIGTMSIFVLCRLLGLGLLSPRARLFFFINLVLQIVVLFSQLYLIRGISLLALGLIAYASARRKIPWLVMAVVLPLIVVLHSGKANMRELYWEQGRPSPGPTQLPAFFSEWIHFGLDKEHADPAKPKASIFDRASLIHMLCLSVDRVPSLKPYLGGESYLDIPALFIPRFLWPDKPSSLLSNIRLALYFDLIDPDDIFKVSIAFGVIAEAYLNFGSIGVVLLGLLFGAGFKRLALLSLGTPLFSALGILMILLTAWSFQAELVMATWISSLFQAAVVCIGIPLFYRKFTQG